MRSQCLIASGFRTHQQKEVCLKGNKNEVKLEKTNNKRTEVAEITLPTVTSFKRPPQNVITMSIDKCVNYAIAHNPNLSVEKEQIKTAESGIAQQDIEEILRRRHNLGKTQVNDFEIRNSAEFQEKMKSTIRTFAILLASITSVSLVVGGIGIMNIMLVSVTERTKEIGIRMAIGARAIDI